MVDDVDIGSLKAGREMDAVIAVEVMGLQHRDKSWWDERGVRVVLPRYSTNRNESMTVERRIYNIGLKLEYIDALGSMIDSGSLLDEEWFFAYYNATPEQRCRAALMAVKKNKC